MSYNPVDALAEGVSNGIDNFAIGMGNDLVNTSSVNGTYDGKMIVDIATFTYSPFQDPIVMSTLKESSFLFVLFALAFILIGGAYVQISRHRETRELLGQKIDSGMSLSNYFKTVMSFIILAPLLPLLMWVVLIFNFIICQLIMKGVISSVIFSPDNVALYLGMCIIYALMTGVFIWRTLIIGITVAYCLILIILLAVPVTRHIGMAWLNYWLIVVFMQPVILALTSVGIGIVQCVVPFAQDIQLLGYLVLCVFLICVSFIFVAYPILPILKGVVKSKIIQGL